MSLEMIEQMVAKIDDCDFEFDLVNDSRMCVHIVCEMFHERENGCILQHINDEVFEKFIKIILESY